MKNTKQLINKIVSFIKARKALTSFICGMFFATPYLLEWLFPFTFLSLVVFFFSITTHESVNEKEKETSELNKKRKKKRIKNLLDFKFFFCFIFGCCLVVYTLFFKLYPLEGYDFTEFQGKILVVFAWIASSLIHATLGGIILGASKPFKNSHFTYALSCGALWVIFEYSLSLGFLAFPWINLSVSLVKFLPFLQTASLFGNGIITFITVFSCCLISLFINNKEKKLLIKVATFILLLNTILGTALYLIPEDRDKEVSVCIIQGNVTMGEKWQEGIFSQVINQHKKIIKSALDNGEYNVVLMAETVFPAIYTENGTIYQTLSKIAEEYEVTIIFGVILKSEEQRQNAIMAIYPDGSTSEPYLKQKLVPFGEKIPELDIIGALVPAIKELNIISSYVAGDESVTITSHDGTIYGPLVCYDSVFSSLARENVLLGAEILAVSTNDSWYKDGAAVRQHQSQSVIRAIETGRYVFRSANTGISCIINSKGNITAESKVLEEAVVCGKGYTSNRKTLFVILGNTSLYFSFVSVSFLFIRLIISHFRKNK